jgi:hypothetical protein
MLCIMHVNRILFLLVCNGDLCLAMQMLGSSYISMLKL